MKIKKEHYDKVPKINIYHEDFVKCKRNTNIVYMFYLIAMVSNFGHTLAWQTHNHNLHIYDRKRMTGQIYFNEKLLLLGSNVGTVIIFSVFYAIQMIHFTILLMFYFAGIVYYFSLQFPELTEQYGFIVCIYLCMSMIIIYHKIYIGKINQIMMMQIHEFNKEQ